MEAYPIHVVEQLTGVKAHTLRIWEKRYQSLNPHRTGTNIRYYDDDQLRKLLNISTLQRHGHKISTLMSLSDTQLNELILKLKEDSGPTGLNDLFVNELVEHMLAFNEPAFDKTCSSAIVRLGLQEAILKVIFPFLEKTGVLWSTSNATPAQEHFASNIIKRKLLAAIDGIPAPGPREGKYILFLPPDEWHELGLLLTDYILRTAGETCIYLGQNLPFESLETAIRKTGATCLVTFFTTGIDSTDHNRKLKALLEKHPGLKILAGTKKPNPNEHEQITWLGSPRDILKQV